VTDRGRSIVPDRAGSTPATGEAGAHRPTAEEREIVASIGRGADARSTGIPSGLGVPAWLDAMLNHCTRCGAELRFGPVAREERDRLVCHVCGLIAYVNPRLVVTALPITAAGEVVLLRRGIEPGRGRWAQPGGFLEVDETVTEAAIRETLEETGLIVEPGEIVGLYTRLEASVVTIAFEARIVGGTAGPTPEATEIHAYAPEDIPWPTIAFTTTRWALFDWMQRRRPDLSPPLPEGGE
jgi:ADP-ribose pyrophosphatase YjhB (NUDIX family)